MSRLLEPGTYIDSSWGHYQGQRIIELANELGWPDNLPGETAALLAKYPDLDPDTSEYEVWHETVDEATNWISEHCAPEGHWFGHHSDIGDVGVWEHEDE